MKNMRTLVIGVLAVALVWGVARVLEPKHQTAQPDPPVVHRKTTSLRPKSMGHPTEPRMARTPVQQQPLEPESTAPARNKLRPKPVEPQTEANQTAQANTVTPNATQTPPDTPAAEETIQDATAQVALAYLGADSDTETYSDEAIPDPSLSAQEGQDGIEDWEEDGLSDAEDPTTADLP